MTILFICNEYPPGNNGGIGTATQNLARQLAKDGHSVLVAGLYPYGYQQKDFETDQGVKVWRKRYGLDFGLIRNNYSLSDTVLNKVLRFTGMLSRDLHKSLNRFFTFLSALIKEHNVDIIEWPDWNHYFQEANRPINYPQWKIPIVVKLHGTGTYIAWQTNVSKDEKIYNFEKQHILRANALIAVSKNLAINMHRFYRLNKKIEIIYNSIETPNLSEIIERESSTVIFSGSLSENKGLTNLMKAWNLVNRVFPSAKLLLYGKGNPKPFQEKLDPAAMASVSFKGHVAKTVLMPVLKKASVAVFPSYIEGFSLSPLEAMGAGCPVIYTKRASGPELIDNGVNGLLVDPDNQREIADNILLLLHDRNLRQQLSQNGRNTVINKFNITLSAKKHIDFYSSVIDAYNNDLPVLPEVSGKTN